MKQIELIARAVIVKDAKVLLCKQKSKSYTFLPGGHIEHGESGANALKRELQEELGLDFNVSDFLGVVEHKWAEEDKTTHEINILFKADSEEVSSDLSPASEEDHIEFLWHSLDDLGSSNILPVSLKTVLSEWIQSHDSPKIISF